MGTGFGQELTEEGAFGVCRNHLCLARLRRALDTNHRDVGATTPRAHQSAPGAPAKRVSPPLRQADKLQTHSAPRRAMVQSFGREEVRCGEAGYLRFMAQEPALRSPIAKWLSDR